MDEPDEAENQTQDLDATTEGNLAVHAPVLPRAIATLIWDLPALCGSFLEGNDVTAAAGAPSNSALRELIDYIHTVASRPAPASAPPVAFGALSSSSTIQPIRSVEEWTKQWTAKLQGAGTHAEKEAQQAAAAAQEAAAAAEAKRIAALRSLRPSEHLPRLHPLSANYCSPAALWPLLQATHFLGSMISI